MFVFEIVTPGTWLDHEDFDWSWNIPSQLQRLESLFFEANTALNLFVNVQQPFHRTRLRDQWERG